MFPYLKALHIIFVVTWFAGLFYIVRLFVYYREAEDEGKTEWMEQYRLMQRRLWYGITWPSAILATLFGLSLLAHYAEYPAWLVMKLFWVAGLWGYQILCQRFFRRQQNGLSSWSSLQFRMWNEVATLFLFAIVFLVVLKDTVSFFKGFASLVGLSLALFVAIRQYKKIRSRK